MKWLTKNILYVFIVLLPIIDVSTSLIERFIEPAISPGMVVRGLLLIAGTLYLLIKKDSAWRRVNLIYICLMALYFIGFFLSRVNSFYIQDYYIEIKAFIKFAYYPLILLFLLNYSNSQNFDKTKLLKSLKLSIIIYSLGIIIPYFTGTAFNSYRDGNLGISGWFYSANEMGIILALCLVLLFFEDTKKWYDYVVVLLLLFALSLLGTKVVVFSTLLTTILFFIINLFRMKFNFKKSSLLFSLVAVVFSLFMVFTSPTIANVLGRLEGLPFLDRFFVKTIAPVEVQMSEYEKERWKNHQGNKIIDILLSSRQFYLEDTFKEYKNANLHSQIFGLGYVHQDHTLRKLVELDYFDLFFDYGVTGFIILACLPFIIFFKAFLKSLKKITYQTVLLFWGLFLAFGVACSAGHVIGAPAVSGYLSIFITLYYVLSVTNKGEQVK